MVTPLSDLLRASLTGVREVEVALELLHPMTAPKAIEELSAILDKEPIEHPIVVYVTNKEEWTKQKEQVPYIYDSPDVEGYILQIRCGHNRVAILKRRGEKSIRALIFNNIEEATAECARQNKWHKQRYGALI